MPARAHSPRPAAFNRGESPALSADHGVAAAALGGVEHLVGALGLAERVLAAVRSSPGLAKLGVTVSGGVAQWTSGDLPDDLLRRADEALYAAKRDGGDAAAG